MTGLDAWRRRCWSSLGPAGVCGVLAAIASVWVHGVAVQQREDELAVLTARVAAVSAAGTSSSRAPERAAAFEAAFPAVETLPDLLERVERASAATGVTVQRTDYRLASESSAALARYQIALPANGTYGQVRAFVSALLESVPTLAVNDIEMRRDAVGVNAVEARVNVSVYLRGAPR